MNFGEITSEELKRKLAQLQREKTQAMSFHLFGAANVISRQIEEIEKLLWQRKEPEKKAA